MCWRLARQLANEHGARVTLWVDRTEVLAALVPAAAGASAGTALRVDGVDVVGWSEVRNAETSPQPATDLAPATDPAPATDLAPPQRRARPGRSVLVSAFGCELPAGVRASLARTAPQPLWVNLEYLSAEAWVEGCHGLASRKPADGAVEHFYYPGFTDATGGLLRERDLLAARGTHVVRAADDATPAEQARRISLLCYPHAPIARWLELLAADTTPTTLLVPTGVAEAELARLVGQLPATGTVVRVGRLSIERFAFLPQPEYDRLLWSCDLNLVRGEDSWVRAIWAGKPFVWQPYRQTADTHVEKLDAFLARFATIAGGADDAMLAFVRAWNGQGEIESAWPAFASSLERIAPAYARFSRALAATPDLAARLVEFCRIRL